MGAYLRGRLFEGGAYLTSIRWRMGAYLRWRLFEGGAYLTSIRWRMGAYLRGRLFDLHLLENGRLFEGALI